MPDSDITRIEISREGGFTGIPVTARVELASLPPHVAHRLREMVTAADFINLPTTIAAPARGADRFVYSVTVGTPDDGHTVRAAEGAMPSELKALVGYVMKVARELRNDRDAG
jgi:hypothetical protein